MKKLIISKKYSIVLAILFALAIMLRLVKLGSAPEALTWDEAALGYNSYSLYKTGADEYGYRLPLVLRSFDDYKPALYAYFSIPAIHIFGLNIFSIRLVSAISGATLVISIYILALNSTKNRLIAIIAALFTAAAPILLLYSRIALEANLSLAFFTAGMAFIIKKDSLKSFLAGSILLIISAYSYHSARYLVPLIVFMAIFHGSNPKIINKKYVASFVHAILFLPIIYFIFNPIFNTRFSETSIFTKSGLLTGNIIQTFGSEYFYVLDIAGRYLSYFNPYTLFIRSHGHSLYQVNELGIFNVFELPLYIAGLYLLFTRKIKLPTPVIVVLLLSPLPAAVTINWFSPLRAALLWPVVILLSASGVVFVINNLLKHKLLLLSLLCVFVSGWIYYSARATEMLVFYQPYVYAGDYQYGFAQSVPYVKELVKSHKYSNVVIDTPHAQPHIFYLFFSAYPPEKYHEEIKWRIHDTSPRYNFNFGPYVFRRIYWPDDRNLGNSLFVGNEFSLPYDQINATPNAKILKEFYNQDGTLGTIIITTD